MIIDTFTPDQAEALVAPFVNVRFNQRRDANGYSLRRREAIDIRYACADRIDADVRGVSPEGITTFFYSGADFIAWDDVLSLTIREMDDLGNTTASRTVYAAADRIPS